MWSARTIAFPATELDTRFWRDCTLGIVPNMAASDLSGLRARFVQQPVVNGSRATGQTKHGNRIIFSDRFRVRDSSELITVQKIPYPRSVPRMEMLRPINEELHPKNIP